MAGRRATSALRGLQQSHHGRLHHGRRLIGGIQFQQRFLDMKIDRVCGDVHDVANLAGRLDRKKNDGWYVFIGHRIRPS